MGNLFSCGPRHSLDDSLGSEVAPQTGPRTTLLENPQVSIVQGTAFKINLGSAYNGFIDKVPVTFVKTDKTLYLSKINHSNIAKFFFMMTIDKRPYLVFEHLAAPLSKRIPYLGDNYGEIIEQLSDAVEYLHQKGVTGAALKPENVCVAEVDQKFVVKLVDFSEAVIDNEYPSTKKCDDITRLGSLFLNIFSKGSVNRELPSNSTDHILMKRTWSTSTEKSPSYDEILCANLIHKMKFRNPDERLTASEVRSHPFFWDASEILKFIIDINKLIEKERTEKIENGIVNRLYKISRFVLGGNDWSSSIGSVVRDELMIAKKNFHERNGGAAQELGGGIVALLVAMRNTAVHHQQSEVISDLMGTDELFVGFWLRKFPRLLQEVYNVKIDVDEGKPFNKAVNTPKADKRPRRNKQKA